MDGCKNIEEAVPLSSSKAVAMVPHPKFAHLNRCNITVDVWRKAPVVLLPKLWDYPVTRFQIKAGLLSILIRLKNPFYLPFLRRTIFIMKSDI